MQVSYTIHFTSSTNRLNLIYLTPSKKADNNSTCLSSSICKMSSTPFTPQRHLSILFSPPNQRALRLVKKLHGCNDRCLRFGFSYSFRKQKTKTKNKNKKGIYFFAIVDSILLLGKVHLI